MKLALIAALLSLGVMDLKSAEAGEIRVMTRNLYIGGDVTQVFAATSALQVPVLVSELWAQVQAADFPGSDNALLRVHASDGVRSGSAISELILIDPKPPRAAILAPEDGKIGRAHV